MDKSHGLLFKRYLEIETAGGIAWHPNSKEIAFVYDHPGQYQVYSVKVEPGLTLWPTRLTFESDRCTDPYILKDGSLVFHRDYGGNENFQLGVLDQNLEVNWITTDLSVKHLISLVTDSAIYYSANIENKTAFALYRQCIPLNRNEQELLYQPEQEAFFAFIEALSPTEEYAIVQHFKGNNDQELLLLELANGSIKHLSHLISGEQKIRWNALRWVDEKHILVRTDYRSNFLRLALISLDGEFHSFTEIDDMQHHDVEEVTWNKTSDYTYFSLNINGYSRLFRAIFTVNGISEYQEIVLPDQGVFFVGDYRSFTRGLNLSPDGKKLGISFSSPKYITNVWIYDIETQDFWMVTNASTAGLDSSTFCDASLHAFLSFDGLQVPYFRYIPSQSQSNNGWPAILIIHGGPEAQSRPSFSPIIQYFLSTGFAIITPNIRGSTGYGRQYLDLDNVGRRLDSIHDIEQLVQHLKTNDPQIDSDRLVIYGGSYGGFAALSAMTEYPHLWKAGVDLYGIANFVTFLKNTAPWRRSLREVEYGSLEHDLNTLIRISPLHKVDQISAPLFIIAGNNDERVPVSESIQIYETLKAKGLPVELLRFPDEGHGITKLENKILAYSKISEWVEKFV